MVNILFYIIHTGCHPIMHLNVHVHVPIQFEFDIIVWKNYVICIYIFKPKLKRHSIKYKLHVKTLQLMFGRYFDNDK